jgi:hypothetical protein
MEDTIDTGSTVNIDKEKLQRLLPKGSNHKVTDEIIDLIANMEENVGGEVMQEYLEESFLSNLPVFKTIKVDIKDYINAIKYCNLKRGMTNERAWEITFPEKYARLKQAGKQTSNHVAMYNGSKIVVKLDAMMALDIKIQYAPFFHQAIKKQVELMTNDDVSFHVQHLASKALTDLLAPKEEEKVSITIGQSDEAKSAQAKTLETMRTIAENQQKLLQSGKTLEEVQRLNLTIEVDVDDDGE